MTDIRRGVCERTGMAVAGAFAFGDSPALADELLAFVRRGTKRATVGAAQGNPRGFPSVGARWALLDGGGNPRFVMETTQVTRGPMGAVTPAFAWDEGEYDRTVESWLEAHRRFFARRGVDDPDGMEVAFERFRIIWPRVDTVTWLTGGVRELQWDERDRLRRDTAGRGSGRRGRGRRRDRTALPGLVCESGGRSVGVLAFRPRPGGETECRSLDTPHVPAGGDEVLAALTRGAVTLGRRNGWRRLSAVARAGDPAALRAYSRHGWTPVGRGGAGELEILLDEPPGSAGLRPR